MRAFPRYIGRKGVAIPLVFQYGSNMSVGRLNDVARLAGAAKPIGIAKTVEKFELAFTIFSRTNNCAAADIVPSKSGRAIYGVVYEIPEFLLSRETAKAKGRKSLDAIEGEGTNYVRSMIELTDAGGSSIKALTYVVKNRTPDLLTSLTYVQHILQGLKEHGMPSEYRDYVRARIVQNNSALADEI